ncbi:hypothetical protein CFP56_028055 [Quercus suber]|uniref:Uncharacterized protein n=1 Tax=Quercus suber TaxID=58331 RepID=A0AAW0JX45_QUESU
MKNLESTKMILKQDGQKIRIRVSGCAHSQFGLRACWIVVTEKSMLLFTFQAFKVVRRRPAERRQFFRVKRLRVRTHHTKQSVPPISKLGLVQIKVTTIIHLPHPLILTVVPSFLLPRQLMKPTRRLQHPLQYSLTYTMIHHLEEPHFLRCSPDSVNSLCTPKDIDVDVSEVDDRNCELGFFALDCITGDIILRRSDKNSWEFGDIRVYKAFDTSFGIVKYL